METPVAIGLAGLKIAIAVLLSCDMKVPALQLGSAGARRQTLEVHPASRHGRSRLLLRLLGDHRHGGDKQAGN